MSAPTLDRDVILGGAQAAAPMRRRTLVLVVLALLAAFVTALLVMPTEPSDIPLDPENPRGSGSRALAQVLRSQGVTVDVVRTAEELDAAAIDGDTTLVAVDSVGLTDVSTESVRNRAADAGRLVLVGLPDGALESLGVPYTSGPAGDIAVRPGCDLDLVAGLGRIEPVRQSLTRRSDLATSPPGSDGVVECYPAAGGHALVEIPETDDMPVVDVLATSDILHNRTITTESDAALALRLLGQNPRVVWFVPDDAMEGAGTPVPGRRIAPEWLMPVVWLLLGIVVLTMWWRGRRLGPLATEPLPVLVRSAETTLARGRLYRRSRDRGHAADILRTATRRRLATRLGLPRSVADDTLVATVASATGRTPDAVRDLLLGPAPTTDPQLAQVAQDLAAIEEEIR